MAVKTQNTYQAAVSLLQKFQNQYNLSTEWPVNIEQIVQFLAFLSLKNLSQSTIITYLSGISYHHKVRGLKDNTKSFIVNKVLEGIKRCGNKKKDIRSPITLPLLDKLISALPSVTSSKYESLLFSASFSLAFYAFLRISEFTAPNGNNYPNRAINISDVKIDQSSKSLYLCIRQSKTDQYGNSVTLLIKAAPHRSSCPLANVLNYLESRPNVENKTIVHSLRRETADIQESPRAHVAKFDQFRFVDSSNAFENFC